MTTDTPNSDTQITSSLNSDTQITPSLSSDTPDAQIDLPVLQSLLVEQTFIQYSTIPEQIQESYYPHFLLWKPEIQNSEIKKPPFPRSGWQLPINLKTYHQILDSYKNYHESKGIFSLSLATLYQDQQLSLPQLLDKHSISIQQIDSTKPPIGIGFAYNLNHPFICIDIDAASESNNELLELLPSYTEWSPSSDGLHIIVQLPTAQDKQALVAAGLATKYNKSADRDLFISSGYVTLTGRLTNMPNRDKIRIFPVKELIDILTSFFQSKIQPIPTPLMQETQKSKSKSKKPVATPQVQKYLDEIPVQCLYATVFDDLFNDKQAILDPKCTEEARAPWLIVGQALHHNFSQFPLTVLEGYSLWNEWSQLGNKYSQEDLESAWRSFGKQSNATESPRLITIGALIKLFKAQQPQFPTINERGIAAANFLNLETYLDFYKFQAQLNVINNQIELIVPPNRVAAWNAPAINKMDLKTQVIFMKDNFKNTGFGARNYAADEVAAYICTKASALENHYNPIKEYFEKSGKNWDGQDRLPQLYSSISLVDENPVIQTSVHEFIRRWFIQVVASACRSEHSNSETIQQFSTVLIFTGSQGIGKTRWAQSLFPKDLLSYCLGNKEIHLNASGNEYTKVIMEIMSTIICNINEIDSHFTLKSYSKFKSFLDTDTFKLVLPYGKKDEILVKRTSFIGSTNKERFLVDPTGNRRIEIIKCTDLNPEHNLDLDQFWGQIHTMFISKEKWWFDPKDPKDLPHIQVRDNLNSQAMLIQDNWYLDVLKEVFDFDEPRDQWTRKQWDRANINRTLQAYDPRLRDRFSNKVFKEQLDTLKTFLTGLSYGHPISYNSGATRARTCYYMPSVKFHIATLEPEPKTSKKSEPKYKHITKSRVKAKNPSATLKTILESEIPKSEIAPETPKSETLTPETPKTVQEQADEDFKKLYCD